MTGWRLYWSGRGRAWPGGGRWRMGDAGRAMKTNSARAFALALFLSLVPAYAAHAAGWSLTFYEEFQGATLDRSVWATRLIYGNETLDHLNDEAQRYRDNDNHQLK